MLCQRWADAHGHELVAANFSDAAVSGASARLLSGLQGALRSAFHEARPV